MDLYFKPYNPRLPFLKVAENPAGGFVVLDTRSMQSFTVSSIGDVHRWAAERSSAQGYMGAGDVVHSVAQRLGFGKSECTPCAQRQAQLNGLLPRMFRRR